MKTRIQWRGVSGWGMLAGGGVAGGLAPFPVNGVTFLALGLLVTGGLLVGTVISDEA